MPEQAVPPSNKSDSAGEAQAKTLLDFAVSHSNAIFYIADLEGKRPTRFISSNVEALTGHKPARFSDQQGFGRDCIHPEDRADYEVRLAQLHHLGELTLTYRYRTSGGQYRWFRDDLRLIEAKPDEREEFLGCMIDISDQVTAEEKSERLAGLLQGAVDSMPNGLGLYDQEGTLILCNGAFAADLGLRTEDTIGLSAREVTSKLLDEAKVFDGQPVANPDDLIETALARARQVGGEPFEVELKSARWLQVTNHPIGDGNRVVVRTDITRLKLAEASLRDSEEQFRSIVEANPSPVRVADFETWEILYESPAAASLFGHPWPASERRHTSVNYADEEQRQVIIRHLKQDRRIDNFEIEMQRADGSSFWIAMSSRVVPYRGRDVSVTSMVDLTETKKRENELRQAQETLIDAIEALSDGFILYDAEDRLVLCNSQYRAYHLDSQDLLVPGAYWPDVTRARGERGLFVEAAGNIEAWLAGQMAQRGIAQHEEFRFAGDRWFEYSHRPTQQGGFVSTWRDITERKEMEEALRQSEELVRRVLTACPVPITMSRPRDGIILYESPAMEQLLGYDKPQHGQSVVGRWADLGDRETHLARLGSHGAVDGHEIQFRRADGSLFWGALSSRAIKYNDEEVVVSSIYDLTERRKAEAELARQRDLLHQSEKLSALGELLAGVSHELNNPLSVLVGQALLLQETAPDAQIAERAKKMGEAADRCARIVKTFLAMARQGPQASQPVDLAELINGALDVTGYSLRVSGVEVALDLQQPLPVTMADPDQIQQVITNLIVNAEHALQEIESERRLAITARHRTTEKDLQITVTDNGAGISEEIRTRIFEPLYTTKEVGTGTGMGLALCHRILEAHGGSITVDSTLGAGATFTVRLPVVRPEKATTAENAVEAKAAKQLSILVVDDDYDVGEIISDVLSTDGHAVEISRSGQEALGKTKDGSYDVILSDIRMPQMDGPTFYRMLTEIRPDLVTRMAFITGDTLSPKVKEFLEQSGRPFMEKPIRPKDIRALVEQLSDSPKA